MNVLSAEARHVPEIVEVWKATMDYHADLDRVFAVGEAGPARFEELLWDDLNSEDVGVWVCEQDEKVAGFIIAQIRARDPIVDEKVGEILVAGVLPEYRRKGGGEKLLRQALDWLSSRKIPRVELNVAVRNQIGYSFWKKMGFRDYMHVLYREQ